MKPLFKIIALAGTVAIASIAPAAVPGQFEDIDRLERRVTGALGAEIGQVGGPAAPIDRRLKLARCPSPAEIDPPALGALALRCNEIGWRIRVPLVRLASATVAAVKAEPVVRKGDPVQFLVETGSFSVSTEAIAQEDGGIGDRIRVKTDRAAPVIIAEVVDGGRVRLPGYR